MSKLITLCLLLIGLSISLTAQKLDSALLFSNIELAQKSRIDSAINLYQQSIDIVESNLKFQRDSLYWMEKIYKWYDSLGGLYFRSQSHQNSLECNEKMLSLTYRLKKPQLDSFIQYNRISVDYKNLGEPYKAEQYLKKAESLYEAEKDTSKIRFFDLCINFSAIYENLREYPKAMDYLRKGDEVYKAIQKPDTNTLTRVVLLYNNLGANLFRIKSYEKAIETLWKSLTLKHSFKDKYKTSDRSFATTYQGLGRVHTSLGREKKSDSLYEQGEQLLRKSLEYYAKAKQNNPIIYNELSYNYYLRGDFSKAIPLSDTALKPFLRDTLVNYPLSLKPYTISEGNACLEIMAQRIDAFRLGFIHTKNQNYIDKAKDCINKAIEVCDTISNRANIQGTKENLQAAIQPIYERAIRLVKEQYNVQNDDAVLDEIFRLFEKSKALTLAEAVNASRIEKYNNIDSKLLKEARETSSKITQKEREIYLQDLKAEKKDSVKYKELRGDLFDLQRKREDWVMLVKQKHPDYHKLVYDRPIIKLKALQQKLQPNQIVLSYFVGDTNVYILVIKAQKVHFETVKKGFPLEEWVDTLRSKMVNITRTSCDNCISEFTDKSFALYQKLILPITSWLPRRIEGQKPHQLIIIPDGVLGYLPFEALLLTKPNEPSRFANHKYLIHNHIISYNFSASLWLELQKKEHKAVPKNTFVGYAPFYKKEQDSNGQIIASVNLTRSNFDSLPRSGEELKQIKALTEGDIYLGEKANFDTYLQTAAHAKIVHLATHGVADNKISGFSYLAFAPDSLQSGAIRLMYVKDLYNQTLNADMVVLSACETGIGKLQKGEGIISLSRGFIYAGAKSVVYSLWQVYDKAGMEILVEFYKNLKYGYSKDEALWKSKIDYLNGKSISNGKANHPACYPFFWAPLVATGDLGSIKF